MRYKVFTSYKYGDEDVKPLGHEYRPTVRGYVDKFEDVFKSLKDTDKDDKFIFKGEEDGQDLSGHPKDFIRNKLSEQIYESTVTVLFVSPNMVTNKRQSKQWIPWEISYSLRRLSRKGHKTSEENAVVAVVLPDRSGSYKYFKSMRLFNIVKANIDNGYIEIVTWNDFLQNVTKYMDRALARRNEHLEEVVRKIV